MDYLKTLNEEQLIALITIKGRVFILAGAGSGKTATLVARTANMIDNGINPENILMLTFTKKATEEMQNRIEDLIGPEAKKVVVKTFHGFCMRMLFEFGTFTGLSGYTEVIDNVKALDIMAVCKEQCLEDHKKALIAKRKKKTGKDSEAINLRDFPSKRTIFSYYAQSIESCTPIDLILKGVKYSKQIKKILKLYAKYKEERNLLDYEDMMRLAEEKLRENPELRKAVNEKYQYVSCDEYQDTNIVQNKILDYITEFHGNLTVVGDDNQSIYAFRFANVENILSFTDRYPDCKQIILNKNYRSSQEVLDFANEMMHYAPEGIKKDLTGTFNGEKPYLVCCDDEFDEAKFILEKIKEHSETEKLSEIAVLCRNGFQSYVLESALAAERIPFKKFGGMKFTEKLSVRAVIAFLSLSENIYNEPYLLSTLKQYPGIGSLRAQECATAIMEKGLMGLLKFKKAKYFPYLQEFITIIDKISSLPFENRTGFTIAYYIDLRCRCIELKDSSDSKKSEDYAYLEESSQDLEILENLATKFDNTSSFLNAISTESIYPENVDGVNISTIHSAKGLEYKTVFVLDCIDGVFPMKLEEYPEELRCMYVAVTRAKENLYIMYPAECHAVKCKGRISTFINKDEILEKVWVI